MKKNKLVIWLCITLLLLLSANAQQPVEPVGRTDQLIKLEHENTRAWCQAQWIDQGEKLEKEFEDKAQGLEDRFKTMMWFDRVTSFISIFCAVFLGATLRGLFDLRSEKRKLLLDQQEATYADMPEPPPPDLPELEND